jgi:dienelactone hydrolase
MKKIILARSFLMNSLILFRYTLCAFAFLAVFGCATSGVYTQADQYGPSQTAYIPPSGRGPVVIMLSGASGPEGYRFFASELAKVGYYTILLDGNVIMNKELTGAKNLKNVITRAQTSSNGLPGKVAVIGYSLGSGGALAYATSMPDVVSAIVAYYPYVAWLKDKDMNEFVTRFKMPILVLAGELDSYLGCCKIEKIRAMDSAAKSNGVPFELVVYPSAEHAFNRTDLPVYRADDTADAWRRTIDMLRRHHPLH